MALIRAGHDRAFEVLFDRYHARLLAFCRHMLGSAEDAEDVLQEVFANAHAAMLGDTRHINVRPWLYRIARNRCLNHLRKPVPEGQESMDVHPHAGGTTTAERVQAREDFRALVAEVQDLPETQRTALLLREIDALSYEDIASAMDTTVPAVKSLLVRARMSLAEASQSRLLTCGDVRLELAEAAEGLLKASGPVRHHVRGCEPCREYRSELRANGRALASLAPAGLLVWLQALLGAKLFGAGSGSVTGGSATATGAGAAACGTTAAAGGGSAAGGAAAGGAALSGAAAAGGGVTGVLGAKAAAGLATAALLTAGAVEVKHLYSGQPDGAETKPAAAKPVTEPHHMPSPATATAAAAGDRDRSEQRDARATPTAEAGSESEAIATATASGAGSSGTTDSQAQSESGSVAGPAAGGSGSSEPAEAGASGDGTAILVPDADAEEPLQEEESDGGTGTSDGSESSGSSQPPGSQPSEDRPPIGASELPLP